jgi:hypothetical protein
MITLDRYKVVTLFLSSSCAWGAAADDQFLAGGLRLIVVMRFISKNNCAIWKIISIILQGIHIAKAPRGQETFNRLSILCDHQMELQSIKISFLAGLIASKVFMGVYL